jgi:hypothetical protein
MDLLGCTSRAGEKALTGHGPCSGCRAIQEAGIRPSARKSLEKSECSASIAMTGRRPESDSTEPWNMRPVPSPPFVEVFNHRVREEMM